MSSPKFSTDAELSVEDLELLGRVRRAREEESVPAAVRERLFGRVIEEAARSHPSFSVPAGQLVPVQRRVWVPALWLVGAALLCVVFLGSVFREQAPGWLGGSADPSRVAAEPREKGTATAAGSAGERLLKFPIFNTPAQALPESMLLALGPNLLGERPFSAESGAWQVRRWDDLSAEPVQAASHDFDSGVLCLTLGAGERILGGWPWLDAAANVDAAKAPKAVALVAGRPYRLVLKAWAREPLPAQLLIAVGHARLPFSARGGARVPLSSEPRLFVVDFVSAADDPSVGLAFLATGAAGSEPTRVCLSDMALSEGKSE
jgi:hypothetical protein